MNFFKKKKEIRVILWCYGSEGKTNLIYRGFKGIKDYKSIPTIGFNVESIDFEGKIITFWEISGGCKVNELRKNYLLSDNDAIIYLIDSSELVIPSDIDFQNNFEKKKKCIDIIGDIPLLIAITKIDIRKTSTQDIINAYQLQKLFDRNKKIGIIECSSYTLQGIKEIEYWISNL